MEGTDTRPAPLTSSTGAGSGAYTARSSPLTQRAALDYAARLGWPVMVGAPVRRKAGHGLGVNSTATDSGSDVESGVLEPTTDIERVRAWWKRWPDAGIVAPAGECFETVTLPMQAAQMVLEQLTERGAWLGPVMSDDDTVTLLIRAGQGPLWATLVTGRGDGYAHAGRGQLVTLPPGSPRAGHHVAWVVPPTPANVLHLPQFEDLAPLVSSAAPRRRRRRFW